MATARSLQASRLDQGLHYFFGEERIAAGSRMYRLGEAACARIVAEQVLEQLADRLRPERRQRHLAVVRLLHPGGVGLGAEGQQQESRRPRDGTDPLLEDDVAPGIYA